jgi:PAS domain S-box-containing protein
MKVSVINNHVKKVRGKKPESTLKEKLITSEVRYRRLFESAKDGILILDAETGKIIDANPFLINLLGFSKEEFIEKEIWEIGLFKDIAANKDKFSELQQQEYVRYENLPLETAERRKINVEFVSNVYLENRRKIIQCNIRDITKRKKAENALLESETKYRSFFENNMDAILLTSAGENILSVNQAACEMFGYSSYEFIELGRSGIEDISDSRLSILVEERALRGKAKGEVTFIRKDGTHFPAEVSTSLFKSYEGFDRASMIIHDITERKRVEKELILAKENAEKSDHLKSSFLSNMSHEIRTPMNGILGFTELLKEPMLTGEEQKEYIDIIEKSGERMLNLIDDIISISKVESGQMEITVSRTNINELIEDNYSFFRPEVEQKRITMLFVNHLPFQEAIIETDRQKVSSILANLIKNAIKFTEKGSIKIGYVKKGDFLEFFVKDTGIGVQPEQKEMIFERFRQGSESLIRNYEGAGLGLSISKAYVEMLGGKIWVENNPEILVSEALTSKKGSIFYFTIPYNHCNGEKTSDKKNIPANEKENQARDLKILIAEDDGISERLISIATNRISKNILKVGNGAEAVKACRNNPDIDLVLMDIKMPEMDGYEATRQIRKFNKKVIIIAQTAYGLKGDREKAINAGCNEYITKPISLTILNTLIKKLFKKKE